MGKKLDAMKRAAKGPTPKPAEQTVKVTDLIPKPLENKGNATPEPQNPAPGRPPKQKHKHQLKDRLPSGSTMSATYTEEGEGKFWDVTLRIGDQSFTARRSALFAGCIEADRLYREWLKRPTQD